MFTIVVDPTPHSLMAVDAYDVHCVIYRALGGGPNDVAIADLHNELNILDWLDRHHPYVQWEHVAPIYAGLPAAHLQPRPPDPKRRWSRFRKSRVHRTDVPGRCEVTISKLATLDVPLRNYFDDLDNLPNGVTLDKIKQDRDLAREILCDYCFYGGPTKNKLLI